MKQNKKRGLTQKTRILAYLFLSGYALAHLIPYLNTYLLPSVDLHSVMHVINYMRSPDLFTGNTLTKLWHETATTTAPIYFFGLAFPLSLFLSSKWTILSIGAGITLIIIYFSGRNWRDWNDILVATLVLIVLLHTYLGPLEGNRRSFTSLFMIALLWWNENRSFLWLLFLTGLAAGIYPPVALIMLVYRAIKNAINWYQGTVRFRKILYRLTSLTLVFLLLTSPFWIELLVNNNPRGIQITVPLTYELESIKGLFKTFIYGSTTALMRDKVNLIVNLFLLVILVFQVFILKSKLTFRNRYIILLLSGLILWTLAHLLHPLIYQPFKYSRMSTMLSILFPMAENLPETSVTLYRKLSDEVKKIIPWMFLISASIGTVYSFYLSRYEPLQALIPLDNLIWTFILLFPAFLSGISLVPYFFKNRVLGCILIAVPFFILITPPLKYNFHHWRGLTTAKLDGLFKTLRDTSPGSLIAAPAYFYSDRIPAFSNRGVYASKNLALYRITCERDKKFKRAYFTDKRYEITNFLYENNIDFLLIDRRILRNLNASFIGKCRNDQLFKSLQSTKNPYLDRHFKNAYWSQNQRLYLLSAEKFLAGR